MNEITPFDFHGNEVRTVLVNGEPWFVAADVCHALELRDTSSALKMLDSEESFRLSRSDTPHIFEGIDPRVQAINVVNESGLYGIVFQSRVERAQEFRRWVTRDVLPSIRKTGSYVTAPQDQFDVIQAMLDQVRDSHRAANEANERSLVTESRVDAIEGRHDHFAALGYAKYTGLPTSTRYLAQLGRHAAQVGRELGIEAEHTQHEHFGAVNLFPVSVWDAALERM